MMSKFKIGDRVRNTQEYDFAKKNMTGTIDSNSSVPWVIWDKSTYGDNIWSRDEYYLELIKEGKPMARRTFRLLKDSMEIKKGSLVQEACDDGNQEYRVVDIERAYRFDDLREYFDRPSISLTRKTVEKNPKWFVEVFQVLPEYATKEEIKVYKKKGKK